MSKLVVINPGEGDLHKGFPKVTAQLYAADDLLLGQFIGGLPPAPALVELYRNWQLIYRGLCDRKRFRSFSILEDDDELEFDDGGVTNVSELNFAEICENLQQSINNWLKSEELVNISRQLRSALLPTEEFRVILQTNDDLVRRLPWHICDFFQDYQRAEIALSKPEYKRQESSFFIKNSPRKVRILAVFGNSQGIDLQKEREGLQKLPDAEVVFLVNPTRQEFNSQLWHQKGWDIFFFIGHSQTENSTGRIYINENQTNNSLTIEQLEEALRAAIAKGLKLAFFNSCDGLGLAGSLEKLHIPTVIVMREPVPNLVAQEFFKHFLSSFAIERLSLDISVRNARRKLQGLEDDFPGASWLPVICQNPAVKPPTWLDLGGIPPCPYRGLFAFGEEDAHLFFGREQFTSDLVMAVKKKPLVAVVGSSGSGKSSVVFAGLIPSLRQDTNFHWEIVSFRPGNNPFEALAAAIAPVCEINKWGGEENFISLHQSRRLNATACENENATRLVELELAVAFQQDDEALYKIIERFVQQNSGTRLVIIVDQFEELYTLAPSKQKPFLDLLLNAVKLAPAFTLVTTLRADFYGYALSYRPFSDALQSAVLNLGPMSREELRYCIEKPAFIMQVNLENGLTNKLIDAVKDESGRLPLLEFALTQLWSKQRSGLLTDQAYEEIGGVEEALANHAEMVYAKLNEKDRLQAQRIFMQLVHLGEGATATRRLATREEVKQENWDLVTRLATSRLVVTNCNSSTDVETVEIVHEALIRSWGRLEYWLQFDGEFRRWQEQLRVAIRSWDNKDEEALLRGKPLSDAEYWLDKRFEELSLAEISFIKLSLELRDRKLKKLKRRRQTTILGLTSGLVLALSLAGVSLGLWQNSVDSEIKSLGASSEALFASNQQLEGLTQAIKAGQKLKNLPWVEADTQTAVVQALQHSLYKIKEYNRFQAHKGGVNTVVFSPDGQIIATGGNDRKVKLWNFDGTLVRTLKARGTVGAVAFSPNGQIIATATGDTVTLWTLNGKLLRTLAGHQGAVNAVSFSRDGQMIATATGDRKSQNGTVQLWSVDGRLHKTMTGHIGVQTTVAISPDGQTIASGGWFGALLLWKPDGTLFKSEQTHASSLNAVAFSPDGETIATASSDKTVKLLNKDGSSSKNLGEHSDVVWSVSFSPQGRMIATASGDKNVKIYNTNGTLVSTLAGHKDVVGAVSFSLDGKMIATASNDGTIKLWKLQGTSLALQHTSQVYAVAFSPDGKTIATTSGYGDVALWHNGLLQKIDKWHHGPVYAIDFSRDGEMIATASGDKAVKLWKRDGTLIKELNGHNGAVVGVTISPDGKIIASASDDGTVKLWNKDGTLYKTLSGHTRAVRKVAFSPDGKIIASASYDGTVKLWNSDGTFYKTLSGHSGAVTAVAFSPDGKIIASGSADNTVKLWNDGSHLRTLPGHNGAVVAVAFSPDGNTIASASYDRTVKLWKPDGSLYKTLSGHNDTVWGVTFSPNGNTLASASQDGSVILWNWQENLDLNKLLVHGCDWARDYLKHNPNVKQSDRYLCDA